MVALQASFFFVMMFLGAKDAMEWTEFGSYPTLDKCKQAQVDLFSYGEEAGLYMAASECYIKWGDIKE